MLLSVEIGQNIVSLRSSLGITQEDLASSASISVSYLRRIEHGTANITIDILESVSTALTISPQMLIIFSMTEEEILEMLRETKANFGAMESVVMV